MAGTSKTPSRGTPLREIALLRLVAQGLVGPGWPTPADAAAGMLASQAQDLPGAVTSLALRVAGRARQAVTDALAAGQVVRAWPLRGTLHLVAAPDLPWLVALLSERILARTARRRAQLGLDDATLASARAVAEETLAGGGRLTRGELFAAWDAAGVPTAGGYGYHTLMYLTQHRVLCLGPMQGEEQLVVLVDEWVGPGRQLDRDEALAELALRYFQNHGPATVADFSRWAALTAADTRAAAAAARPHLTRLTADGDEHLLDPRTPEILAAHRQQAREVLLLPGFDEFILGYADRGAVLPAAHADALAPGGNGVFRPTVVCDGQVVGTWRGTGRGARRRVDAALFDDCPPGVADTVPDVYARLP